MRYGLDDLQHDDEHHVDEHHDHHDGVALRLRCPGVLRDRVMHVDGDLLFAIQRRNNAALRRDDDHDPGRLQHDDHDGRGHNDDNGRAVQRVYVVFLADLRNGSCRQFLRNAVHLRRSAGLWNRLRIFYKAVCFHDHDPRTATVLLWELSLVVVRFCG